MQIKYEYGNKKNGGPLRCKKYICEYVTKKSIHNKRIYDTYDRHTDVYGGVKLIKLYKKKLCIRI